MQRNDDRYRPFGLSSSRSATALAKRLPRLRQPACCLTRIARIDDVPVAQPRMVVQPHHLLGRVLQVVVHGDHVGAARMAQAGHDRVVLAEIAGVLDIGQRHRGASHQGLADLAGVVRAAVVDQDDLQPARRAQRRQRLDQPADGGGAAIDRHDDGQAEPATASASAGRLGGCRSAVVVHGRSAIASTDPPAGRRKRQATFDLCHAMQAWHRAMAETGRRRRLSSPRASILRCTTISGSSRPFQ